MRLGKASDQVHASPPQPAPRAEAREELASPRRAPLSAIVQRAAVEPRSLSRADVMQLQRTIGNAATARLVAKETPRANRTGLPDRLRAGVEQLSGLSMDDVQVHYNSAKPAEVDALAFTQGRHIHVRSGTRAPSAA